MFMFLSEFDDNMTICSNIRVWFVIILIASEVASSILQSNGSIFQENASQKLKTHLNMIQNLQGVYELLNEIRDAGCAEDITKLLDGFSSNERWALQLFDALPKFPVGWMYGNMYQLGNFDECVTIDHEGIKGQYCLADVSFKFQPNLGGFGQTFQANSGEIRNRFSFNSTLVRWALCLPSSCGPAHVATLLQGIFRSLADFQTLDVFVDEKNCYFKGQTAGTSTGEIVYASIIALVLVFILLATGVHVVQIRKRRKLTLCNAYNIDGIRERESSLLLDIITSFSLIRTVTKLLQTKPTDLNLECIGGVKFLSMMFIVAGHSLIFIVGSPMADVNFVAEMSRRVENSVFMNGPLLVDTFLMVSGFLMCRLLLIELNKRDGKVNFLVLYVARYIRLTPAYAVVLGYYLTWLPKFGDGPLWRSVTETESQRCQQSWWTNLLYINNYLYTDQLCMFQAWYLAADFHLFIVAPFLVYLLWRWPKTGIGFIAILAAVFGSLAGYVTYRDNLDPTFLAFPPEIEDISTNPFFAGVYIKTHMRASSYFLGLLFGYAVHQIQSKSVVLDGYSLWTGWILSVLFGSLSMASVVLFFDPEYVQDRVISAVYAPLHRLAWTLGVGWVLLVCVTDNAGPVNKFLSWKFFGPLSRLTYCSYLVNGAVLIVYKGAIRDAISWTRLGLMFTVIGQFIVTLLCAFVLCICFESPIHGLEKLLLRKKDRKLNTAVPPTILRVVEERETN